MRGSKGILLILSLVIIDAGVVSCTRPVRPGNGNLASYYVAGMPITKVPTANRTIPGWGLVDEKIFTFQTCVVDNSRQQPMLRHRFTVTGPDQPKTNPAVITTDTDGCLNWTETFAFDPLATPTYLRLKRVLQPDGIQRGERIVEYGINPWSGINGDEAAIVDFTVKKEQVIKQEPVVAKNIASLRASATQPPVPLVIETVTYQAFPDQRSGAGFPVQISFNPGYRVTSMSGIPQIKGFTEAQFLVQMQLVRLVTDANGKTTQELKSNEVAPELAKFQNGQAVVNFKKIVFGNIERSGQYILVLSVKPAPGAPAGLGAFEEAYEIADFNRVLRGGTFNKIPNPTNVVGSSSVRAMMTRLRGGQTVDPGEGVAPFDIDAPSISPVDVLGEDTQNRVLLLNMVVPLVWAADGSPMSLGKKFKIKLRPQGQNALPIDGIDDDKIQDVTYGGVIRMQTATLHMNYYKKWERMPYELSVEYVPDEGENVDGAKMVRTQLVCINLADQASTYIIPEGFLGGAKNCSGPALARGSKLFTDAGGPPRVPTMRISGIKWNRDNAASKYAVNNDLSIHIQHLMNFVVTPKVLRFDSPAGFDAANGGRNLRPGFYLLTGTLYLNDTVSNNGKGQIKDILTSFQTVVKSRDGSLNTQVPLDVATGTALPIMTQPNYMAVQVNQLDVSPEDLDRNGDYLPNREFKILPKARTDLSQDSFVFELSPSTGSASVIERDNIRDQRVKDLYAELDRVQTYQRHREWTAQQARLSAERFAVQQDPDRWKQIARFPKETFLPQQGRESARPNGFVELRDYEVIDDKKLNEFLVNQIGIGALQRTFHPITVEVFKKTLECLDKTSWGHKDTMHECAKTPELFKPARELCSLLAPDSARQAPRSWDVPVYAARDSGQPSLVGNIIGYQTPMYQCLNSPFEFLRVQQKTFVYEVDHTVPSEQIFKGGFISNLTMSNNFGIGSFYGTDTGGADISAIRASIAANAVAPFGKAGNLHNGGMVGVGLAGVSLDRSHSAMIVDFQRNYRQNAGGLDLNTTLQFEHAEFEIPIKKYRDCYALRLPHLSNTRGYMFCFPISDKPKTMRQRYYTVFNKAPGGTMINADNLINRFMVEFRGEDSYYNFMATMEEGMRPFFDGRTIPLEVADMLKCNQMELRNRIFELPGTLSSAPPPLADYFRIADRGNTRTMGYFNLYNPFETFDTRRVGPMNDPNTPVINNAPTELAPTTPRSKWCAGR